MRKLSLSLKLILIIIGLAAIIYYYLGSEIPIEVTSQFLHIIINILFALSPLGLWLVLGDLLFEKNQENKLSGCLIPSFMFINLIHNLIWGILLITWGKPYDDINITYPDSANNRKMIIEQHADQGALGDHYRTIEVYALIPGIRIILNKIE